MSELPQPQEGKEWQAAPEQFDELAKKRAEDTSEMEIAAAARRAELRRLADEKYPLSENGDSQEPYEEKAA